jgi:hypothetical protein
MKSVSPVSTPAGTSRLVVSSKTSSEIDSGVWPGVDSARSRT